MGGVDCVQLREKDLSSKGLFEMAKELKGITSIYGANLIINDRVDIAMAVDCSGVHLGWNSIPVEVARALFGDGKIIGKSTHNMEEVIRAIKEGVDYITFGPIFDTPSKRGMVEVTGPYAIKEIKKTVTIPVIALGGIKKENVDLVMEEGANGIALISAILSAQDPFEEARIIRAQLARYERLAKGTFKNLS